MQYLMVMRVSVILLSLALAARATPPTQVANPASGNCVYVGGGLAVEDNGGGGEFGVCHFTDNRQCEEWALFRGDCPVGGVRVAGYATPAARFCAIRGGAYKVTANETAAKPGQGTCTPPGGRACDVHALYAGLFSKPRALDPAPPRGRRRAGRGPGGPPCRP